MTETIIRVVLADAPRDVLIHVVDHGPANRSEIVSVMEKRTSIPVDEIVRGVARGLRLLHELGFVRTTGGGETPLVYTATEDGRHCVMAARAEAQRDA